MAKTSLSVSLEKGLKTTFIEQLKQESSLVDSLATVVPSNSRSETHSWISTSPALPNRTLALGSNRCILALVHACQFAVPPVCKAAGLQFCQSASLPLCTPASLQVRQSASPPVC